MPSARQNSGSKPNDIADIVGRHIKIIGDHPWAGESAEVVGFDPRIGMRVKLLRKDAMYGHECYITSPKNFRPERKGVDW